MQGHEAETRTDVFRGKGERKDRKTAQARQSEIHRLRGGKNRTGRLYLSYGVGRTTDRERNRNRLCPPGRRSAKGNTGHHLYQRQSDFQSLENRSKIQLCELMQDYRTKPVRRKYGRGGYGTGWDRRIRDKRIFTAAGATREHACSGTDYRNTGPETDARTAAAVIFAAKTDVLLRGKRLPGHVPVSSEPHVPMGYTDRGKAIDKEDRPKPGHVRHTAYGRTGRANQGRATRVPRRDAVRKPHFRRLSGYGRQADTRVGLRRTSPERMGEIREIHHATHGQGFDRERVYGACARAMVGRTWANRKTLPMERKSLGPNI